MSSSVERGFPSDNVTKKCSLSLTFGLNSLCEKHYSQAMLYVPNAQYGMREICKACWTVLFRECLPFVDWNSHLLVCSSIHGFLKLNMFLNHTKYLIKYIEYKLKLYVS